MYNNISIYEFNITSKLLELLEIDYDDTDFALSANFVDIYSQTKKLGYCESYEMLNAIPNEFSVFRPLVSDRHANMLIYMFDILNDNELLFDIDTIEYNGKKKYTFKLLNGDLLNPLNNGSFLSGVKSKIGNVNRLSFILLA